MIFEIFMLRFDLLTNYRISILNIFAIFKKNPKKFIFLLPSFITSIEKIAKACNYKHVFKVSTKNGIVKINKRHK